MKAFYDALMSQKSIPKIAKLEQEQEKMKLLCLQNF